MKPWCFTLSSADNYLVDNPATAIVTMADDDSTVVTVTATDATAAEWGPHSGTFTLTRAVASAAPLTVHCQLGGTAEEGTDYLSLPPGILIPPGSTSAVVVVTPAGDDGVAEGDETVILTLAPGSHYTTGTPPRHGNDRRSSDDAWRFSRFTPLSFWTQTSVAMARIRNRTELSTFGNMPLAGAEIARGDRRSHAHRERRPSGHHLPAEQARD